MIDDRPTIKMKRKKGFEAQKENKKYYNWEREVDESSDSPALLRMGMSQ